MKDEANIIIEPMSVADLELVVALERECGLSSYGVERYLKLLSDQNSLMLVAFEQQDQKREVVGLFSASLVIDEAQIDNVAVVERLRRRGIASRLLLEGLAIARRRGASSAVLEVRSENLPACLLYERHGFIVSGTRRNYYHDPSDAALIMTRNLALTQRR